MFFLKAEISADSELFAVQTKLTFTLSTFSGGRNAIAQCFKVLVGIRWKQPKGELLVFNDYPVGFDFALPFFKLHHYHHLYHHHLFNPLMSVFYRLGS